MKKYLLFCFTVGALLILTDTATAQIVAGSQVYAFPTDSIQRGYYNRPYERYEAEPGWCTTDGTFLAADDNQTTLQSEASHQQALQLIAHNSFVSWITNHAGDGLTIRFSLPDNSEGTGTTGYIAVFAGSEQVATVQLNSYWAWQYCSRTYPTNSPSNGPVVRMKYDEVHLQLSRTVNSGEVLKIVKTDNNATPYTIDFVELEPVPQPVTFESLTGNKVQFNGEKDLADFVAENQGKTIYLPAGTWNTAKRIYINADNTQLVGAGMWYTTIYFTASSYASDTYDKRGIECHANNCRVEGVYMNTVNNQRYMNENDSKQVGKGFMGKWGTNSVIRNCWVEHFECGGWIADYGSRKGCHNLLVEHCRFRNNYADGINCSMDTHDNLIQYCSFRNNGDDDMATWSTGYMATNITFAYCTAENNWRASSLGFFGGERHHAHHLYIVDGLESGVRVNSDFNGPGFGTSGRMSIHDITIEHCGCLSGTKGVSGDFWGTRQGALNIGSTGCYAIYNVDFSNIDIVDSRGIAMFIRAQGTNYLQDLTLHNIHVNNASHGIMFSGAKGKISYCNLSFSNCGTDIYGLSKSLDWAEDCGTGVEQLSSVPKPLHGFYRNGNIYFRLGTSVFDVLGRRCTF
ncbi:MAG: hypothetical protein MJZ75_03100 [Paludibacteraceae bacterium]|nr:hypothetical protein [Paludibacteraceae bacterium]